jgi:hypothetical protein
VQRVAIPFPTGTSNKDNLALQLFELYVLGGR